MLVEEENNGEEKKDSESKKISMYLDNSSVNRRSGLCLTIWSYVVNLFEREIEEEEEEEENSSEVLSES